MIFKNLKILVLCFLVNHISSPVQSANILFYFSATSYSHRIPVWPIVEELVEKGHNVTFLSPFPAKSSEINPRVTEIPVKILEEIFYTFSEDMLANRAKGEMDKDWELFNEFGSMYCEETFKSPEGQKFLNSGEKFDLVIIDAMVNDCALGLAWKHNAPAIMISTTSIYPWMPEVFGHSAEESTIPEFQYAPQPGNKMPFFQKIQNFFIPFKWLFTRHFSYYPELDRILREQLNSPEMPSVSQLIKENVALVMVNSHFAFDYPRSLPPLYLPIGGLHCLQNNKKKKKNQLTKEIDQFMKGAGTYGVIYISFGTVVEMKHFDGRLIDAFLTTIKNFPNHRFIWKWSEDKPSKIPENLLLLDWAPQQDILAHQSTKAFITHGGLGSLFEALYHKVPVVVFPIFGEQDFNANIVDYLGIGKKLEIVTVEQKELEDSLKFILTDQSLKSNLEQRSDLFRNRPEDPLKLAMWWIEYILVHKNTNFLKPLAMNQYWFEKRLLDIYSFLIASIAIVLLIAWKLLNKLCLRKSRNDIQNVKLKNN